MTPVQTEITRLPAAFVDELRALGLDDLPQTLVSGCPDVSVRVNPAKGGATFAGAAPVAWCPEGVYLPERPSFTLDPRLHQGRYYVQEAASMFHAHIGRTLFPDGSAPVRMLDACAAPGGKTTALLSVLPAGSVAVANEYVPARAAVLRENIVKWGHPGVIVTRGDTAPLGSLRETFDLIVADVPCSGEGMIRKDPVAAAQWNPRLVEECAALQRDIADSLVPALKPGGVMIYSTCTFNRRENEEAVSRLIDTHGLESVAIPVDPSWGITEGIGTDAACYRFIPGRTRGEGLFVAVLRKPGLLVPSSPSASRRDRRDNKARKALPVPPQVEGWLDPAAGPFTITATPERVTAFPAAHADLLARVAAKTDVIHEGVPLATVKGRDLIPAHALALSGAYRRGAFPEASLPLGEALSYLRGEAVALPEGTPRGFVAVTFEGQPLGWVKNLGNRCNNLYPAPYRIKFK